MISKYDQSRIAKPFKALLLDVDGVLLQQPKLFSEMYAQKYNVDLKKLLPFYSSPEFLASSVGKYDLKQAILDHQDKWQWPDSVDLLLDEWFEAERFPNRPLLRLVKTLRQQGLKVVIVTQQEKYRSNYLKKNVFRGCYDKFFVSCDFGIHKDTVEFWKEVVERLAPLATTELIYFDDKKSLVDLANSVGIDAHVYESADQVERLIRL